MKHLAGKKVAPSHTTIIEAASKVARAAKNDGKVKNIVLGQITDCNQSRSGPRIKFDEISIGLKMTVRGNCGIQIFYLTVDSADRSQVASNLTQVFNGKRRGVT